MAATSLSQVNDKSQTSAEMVTAKDKIDIVLIGASYAQGMKLNRVNGLHLLNVGVGGQQSFELLDRFQKDVIVHKPRFVVIWGFINDIFRSEPGKMPETIDRIKESYVKMIRLSKENGITPILATEITMAQRGGFKEMVLGLLAKVMGKQSYQEKISRRVMEVNTWLKEYALKESITVIDFQQALAGKKGLMREKKYTQDDGSHVSLEGYNKLSRFISEEFVAIK